MQKSVAIICSNDSVRAHIRSAFDIEDSVVYIDLASMSSTALLKDSRISLIILHLDSFKMDKVVLFEQIVDINKDAHVFVLSDIPDFAESRIFIGKGAKGYANSRMLIDGLKHAFDAVRYGDIWMPPSFVLELIKKVKSAEQKSKPNTVNIEEKLSKKELSVAMLVSEGHSNQSIGNTLDISERTVKAHLSTIFEKLGIKDRLTLALMVKNI